MTNPPLRRRRSRKRRRRREEGEEEEGEGEEEEGEGKEEGEGEEEGEEVELDHYFEDRKWVIRQVVHWHELLPFFLLLQISVKKKIKPQIYLFFARIN